MEREFDRPGPVTDPGPVKPSEAELAREREAQIQEQLRQSEIEAAKAQARAEAMEAFVREGFAQGRTQPPPEAVKAQESLGLSDEDILSDPTGSIARLQEQIRRQEAEMREYQERANSVIGNLAKNNFKGEMQALQKERYGEWITPYVEDYFRKNPEEAFRDGSVRRIYNELVGQNIEELERLHREKTQTPQQRQKVIEAPTRFSASPEPPRDEKKSLLSEEDEFMRLEHNKKSPRYQMTQEEWADIRSGKKFPKKIATDIQVRGAKPNVSY